MRVRLGRVSHGPQGSNVQERDHLPLDASPPQMTRPHSWCTKQRAPKHPSFDQSCARNTTLGTSRELRAFTEVEGER